MPASSKFTVGLVQMAASTDSMENLERAVLLDVRDEKLDGVGADVDGGERPHGRPIFGELPRNAVKTM